MGTKTVQRWVLAGALLGALPGAAGEVVPAPDRVTVVLKDGGRLVGTIVTEDEAAVTLRTTSGLELKLLRDAIASVEPGRVSANGAVPPPPTDPNETRLMFAPTGRPLGKGDGYFSNHYVLFPGFAYGLTGNLSLAGGVSTIPSLGLDEQVYYVSTQLGWSPSPKAALSFGGLYAAGAGEELDAAVLFGITSLGRPDRSLSLGFGLVSTREEEVQLDARGRYLGSTQRWRSEPVAMVGGSLRVGKRVSLLTESWLFLEQPLSEQPFGLALRFFADRISVDVGFVFVPAVIDEGFPIPWLSFSYHFGRSRSAAKGAAPGTMAGLDRGRPQRGR